MAASITGIRRKSYYNVTAERLSKLVWISIKTDCTRADVDGDVRGWDATFFFFSFLFFSSSSFTFVSSSCARVPAPVPDEEQRQCASRHRAIVCKTFLPVRVRREFFLIKPITFTSDRLQHAPRAPRSRRRVGHIRTGAAVPAGNRIKAVHYSLPIFFSLSFPLRTRFFAQSIFVQDPPPPPPPTRCRCAARN